MALLPPLAVFALTALTGFTLNSNTIVQPIGNAASHEQADGGDPCPDCTPTLLTPLLGAGACIVTWDAQIEPGNCQCTGFTPPCLPDEPGCQFAVRPLCDHTCCLPEFQDAAGVWNPVVCGSPTQVWQMDCGSTTPLSPAVVQWRVWSVCPLPPKPTLPSVMSFFCADCPWVDK